MLCVPYICARGLGASRSNAPRFGFAGLAEQCSALRYALRYFGRRNSLVFWSRWRALLHGHSSGVRQSLPFTGLFSI